MEKLTDEQIIKALECCIESTSRNDCEDLKCPACDENGCFFMRKSTEYYPESLIQEMGKAVLEVLKLKDAEIYVLNEALDGETVKNMRLKHEVERLKAEIRKTDNALAKLDRPLVEVKSEAYKDILLLLEAEAESSDKYIREYDGSLEQKAYNQALWKAHGIVKKLTEGGNEDG